MGHVGIVEWCVSGAAVWVVGVGTTIDGATGLHGAVCVCVRGGGGGGVVEVCWGGVRSGRAVRVDYGVCGWCEGAAW